MKVNATKVFYNLLNTPYTNTIKLGLSKAVAMVRFERDGGRIGSFDPGELEIDDNNIIIKIEELEISTPCPDWLKVKDKE